MLLAAARCPTPPAPLVCRPTAAGPRFDSQPLISLLNPPPPPGSPLLACSSLAPPSCAAALCPAGLRAPGDANSCRLYPPCPINASLCTMTALALLPSPVTRLLPGQERKTPHLQSSWQGAGRLEGRPSQSAVCATAGSGHCASVCMQSIFCARAVTVCQRAPCASRRWRLCPHPTWVVPSPALPSCCIH